MVGYLMSQVQIFTIARRHCFSCAKNQIRVFVLFGIDLNYELRKHVRRCVSVIASTAKAFKL